MTDAADRRPEKSRTVLDKIGDALVIIWLVAAFLVVLAISAFRIILSPAPRDHLPKKKGADGSG